MNRLYFFLNTLQLDYYLSTLLSNKTKNFYRRQEASKISSHKNSDTSYSLAT